MPLSPLYVGETHRPLSVTWLDDSNVALDLTGATLSVRFAGQGGSLSFAGTGTFNVTSASTGQFTYTLAGTDVATPGTWQLQFTATYVDSTKEMSDPVPLEVLPTL